MRYTVWYKMKWFWHKIKNVKGDGLVDGIDSRFFILEDETRIEIPTTAMFKFCLNRFLFIKQSMEAESGQSLPVKSSTR